MSYWLDTLVERVKREASIMMEEWDSDERDAYMMAIDNVTDDREVHTNVPPRYDRQDVRDKLFEAVAMETMTL